MKKLSGLLIFIVTACSTPPTADEIVDQAIKSSGVDQLRNASASFTFRNISYSYQYRDGRFEYGRNLRDSVGNDIRDVLTNDGLIRYINQEEAEITNERRFAYSESVNSVIYFAFLPLWLNDPAVNKQYEGTIEIKGTVYHKIRVTFAEEGGGQDFDDVFYYWFDTEDFSMDYLAYSYSRDGGGMRFREAYNSRNVNDVTIQDYKNLKPAIKGSIAFEEIDQAYIEGKLTELSRIELEEVEIFVK